MSLRTSRNQSSRKNSMELLWIRRKKRKRRKTKNEKNPLKKLMRKRSERLL